ncbi:hypothetical protein OOK31_34670 [Streptomyces sp. NBC_00249]|uniref:ADP-ribosyltransferase n=1 Tax=Streptomyces sp. NBC_00249 TaxID=2975690 RepID=UPI002254781E|nr:ADP-ribosyltransferase [Streptomyces sp. NBC_00249]MCX5198973.1 hypothetical protein [Streptomyces sp. NBC_00249]
MSELYTPETTDLPEPPPTPDFPEADTIGEPEQPEPTEPEALESDDTEAFPEEPEPAEPEALESDDTEAFPDEPEPAEPEALEADDTEAFPDEPEPVEPASELPDEDPDSDLPAEPEALAEPTPDRPREPESAEAEAAEAEDTEAFPDEPEPAERPDEDPDSETPDDPDPLDDTTELPTGEEDTPDQPEPEPEPEALEKEEEPEPDDAADETEAASPVREFSSNEEGAEYGRTEWAEAQALLTDEQRDALYGYSGEKGPGEEGSPDYKEINGYLRGYEPGSPEVDDSIQRIDEGLELQTVPEDLTVMRETGLNSFNCPIEKIKGSVQTDQGYLSTALGSDPDFAPDKEVVLHLKVPEGTPAIYMEGLSQYDSERELLLGRGLSYLVTDATFGEDDDDRYHVYGEIIR